MGLKLIVRALVGEVRKSARFWYDLFRPVQIKGKSNEIKLFSPLTNHSTLRVRGENNYIYIGRNAIVSSTHISVTGDNCTLLIGDHVRFYSGGISVSGKNSVIKIGEYTSVRQADLTAYESGDVIDIGPACMFSYKVVIRTSDAHPIFDEAGKRINTSKPIHIGRDVWLGYGATVLKGCTIGEGAVIGYGSICTHEIPARCVAAGIPAKVVKENITWTRNLTRDEE